MATFAEIITELRAEKGKKRQEVADALGISRASLEYYEKGQRKPDYEVLARLADYYGVSADYMLGRTGAKTTDRDIQFVCDYTGMDDTSIQRFHSNIGTSFSICNEINGFFLSDKAIFDYVSLCEFFEKYKQNLQELIGIEKMKDELSLEEYKERFIKAKDNLYLSEFRVQKSINKLLEIYSGERDDSFSDKEQSFAKLMVSIF